MKKLAQFLFGAGSAILALLPAMASAQGLLAPGGGGTLGVLYGTATGLGTRDVRATIANIINVALGLLGIVAVVIIVAGGFIWMTSGGNEEKVDKAKDMIFMGIIGLAIILSAYAIAQFVISQLVNATTGVAGS